MEEKRTMNEAAYYENYKILADAYDNLLERMERLEDKVIGIDKLQPGMYYIKPIGWSKPTIAAYIQHLKLFDASVDGKFYVNELEKYEKIPEPTI